MPVGYNVSLQNFRDGIYYISRVIDTNTDIDTSSSNSGHGTLYGDGEILLIFSLSTTESPGPGYSSHTGTHPGT